jgi:hypothetical protein
MTKTQIIKFSKNFPKLDKDKFTTIRRYDKYKEGGLLKVRTPKTTFQAVISRKTKKPLGEIDTPFLLEDTNTQTREEALKLINSFYRKPLQDQEVVTILYLTKIEDIECPDFKIEPVDWTEIKIPECKIDLEGVDVELKGFDVKLPKNLGLTLLGNQDLLKIIKDLQDVGDIKDKDPGELLKHLRTKWHKEE